jgi:anti-sigma factor RsiW
MIHGYVDGELELARSLEVEQHIHECDVCARTYRNQTVLRSALKHDSLYYSAPEKLKKRIQSTLRKESRSRSVSTRVRLALAYRRRFAGLYAFAWGGRVEICARVCSSFRR